MKRNKEIKQIEWIDVHEDALMVSLGIRPKDLIPRDPSVWEKTSKEKNLLRKLRRRFKTHFSKGIPSLQPIFSLNSKLIVTIKPSDKFIIKDKNGNKVKKTTFSIKCNSAQIPHILAKFNEVKNGMMRNLVIKYYWNGKTYKKHELPYECK